MNVLELFAGSRSIGKVAEKYGYNVFSVDINDFDKIDLVIDILELNKGDIPFKPDVIWASPPCTYFSVASIGKHWNKDHTPKTDNAKHGLAILRKTLKIINWFPEALYFIENPRGKMRKVIGNLPRATVWYCQYGFNIAKPTDIWTNNLRSLSNPEGWQPRPECWNGRDNCHQKAPRGSRTGVQGIKGNYNRSKIPEQLCEEIIKSCHNKRNLK